MSAYGNITCQFCGVSYYELHSHTCEEDALRHEITRLREQVQQAERKIEKLLLEAAEWEQDISELEREKGELVGALKMAEQFISNGVEFGYIRMPDKDTPDSAHQTLPLIRGMITKHGERKNG